jgi:hypothetical protein
MEMISNLNQLLLVLQEEKDVQKYEKMQDSIFSFIESTHKSINEFTGRTDLGDYPAQISSLLNLLKERFTLIKQKSNAAVLYAKNNDKKTNQQRLSKLKNTLSGFDKSLIDVDKRIEKLL